MKAAGELALALLRAGCRGAGTSRAAAAHRPRLGLLFPLDFDSPTAQPTNRPTDQPSTRIFRLKLSLFLYSLAPRPSDPPAMAATLSTSIARGPLSLRSLFAAPSSLRSTFSSPLAWASSSSAPSTSNSYIAASGSAAALSPFAEPRSLLGGLLEQLLELFPSILLAVPKKQTTHRRKRMRQNGKGPKDKQSASLA